MANIESMLFTVGIAAIILFSYMIVAFAVGTIKKNNSLVDIFYGLGFFVVSFMSFITDLLIHGTTSIQKLIVVILVLLWAIRLATYVYTRNHGKPEDYRYAAMRKRWKTNVILKSLLKIYLFQGLIILIVDIPSWFVIISDNPIISSAFDFYGITLWVGILVWMVGFLFETIGDWSLYHFLQNPENKGKIMDRGLWKYTQHPNYFGEITQWWGLYVIALGVPFGFITFFGPALITFMIIKVSGVSLLNKRFEKDNKYAEYRRRTSAFFPWFPKKIKLDTSE